MSEVSINGKMKLSEHFTLGELTKTSHKTADGNIPSRVVIENLKRVCEWLEELRSRYNQRYGDGKEPIMINSGYRSPAVNKKAGGAVTSNHLTGCAVDIKCFGKEQALRYAVILMDYADDTGMEFDEMLLEKSGTTCWLHFAVRPSSMPNRRKVDWMKV
jgi:hypothetical protein